MTIPTRIERLRDRMKAENIQMYIIPMKNTYLNSDLEEPDMRIKYVSGFDGSAGLIFITQNKISLFVDGRYTLQAKLQVDSNIYEINELNFQKSIEWIKINLEKNSRIGFDPKLHSIDEIENYTNKLENNLISFVSIDQNLVDLTRTDLTSIKSKDYVLSIIDKKNSGLSILEKLSYLRIKYLKKDNELIFTQDNDIVSWISNLRALSKEYTPSILGTCILTKNNCYVLIPHNQILPYKSNPQYSEIEFLDEDQFDYLLNSELNEINIVKIDKKNTSVYFKEKFIKKGYELISFNELEKEKSIKNETELKNIMSSHIYDGQAICKFIYWLKNASKKKPVDEIIIINKLEQYRSRSSTNYLGPSFPAIVGFRENGAIIHYRAKNQSCKKISGGGLILIDSGGQYKYGTTDITRTLLIGDSNKTYSRLYTIVLKAHIALARRVFDSNTTGSELDKSSREIIEFYGYNYNHGTGHGVGYLLSVHEGPLAISPKESRSGFYENMVFSNEPGIYIEGELGIRIENLMVIRKDTSVDNTDKLYFEPISFAPFERNLIDKDILNKKEVDWINKYHEKVYKKLSIGLGIETKEWLSEETASI